MYDNKYRFKEYKNVRKFIDKILIALVYHRLMNLGI